MKQDLQIFNLIKKEEDRQTSGIELIASENYVSEQVLEALGSICTNKYAEGYPGARYYGGCEVVDQIEQLAIDRLCELFEAEYANVQPHSGSQANTAAYVALLQPGDKVLFIDDFLANGNAGKGIIDLVEQAGAELVGMGFLIEKSFQDGGTLLRSTGIHVESLAIIESLDNCEIKFKE